MRWSLKLVRVAGIDVRVHFTFLLFLAWIALAHYQMGGRSAMLVGVTFIVALFTCVLLHEFGHALAARAFGIRTPDITLLPIGGVARLQRMPEHPGQELIVALAGPAVNLLIAAVLIFFLGRHTDVAHLEFVEQPRAELFAKLASMNLALAFFNLIPAFPMDGGRVLRALLAMFMPYGRATQIAASAGQALAFVLGFLGLFYNPMLIFVAFFVFLGAQQEAALAQLKDASSNLSVSEAMMTHLMRLRSDAKLEDAVEMLLRTSQHEFPVLDDDERVLGVLTRDDMIVALRKRGADTPVADVMRRDLPSVREGDAFNEALHHMQQSRCPVLPVVDAANRFVGLITPENLGELMLVQSLRSRAARPVWRTV